MRIPSGFLEEFSGLLLKRYNNRINRDYAFSLAEVLLSACCWNIKYTNGYGSGQPNIWIQVILPSGDVKSNPLNKMLFPIMKTLEHNLNEGSKLKYKIIISQYTPESIIKFMGKHPEEVFDATEEKVVKETHIGNVGLIIVDESSSQARGTKSKDYMSGLLEIDSLIYDGHVPERFTIAHGLSKVDYCYKAKISATTPVIYGIMEEADVIQGGWNRFDIIVGLPINPEILKEHDPETFFQHRTQEELDDEYDYYATQLLNVIQTQVGMIYFTDDAAAMWCKYEHKQKTEALKLSEKDLRRGYKNRMAEKVLKRAVLYAISRHIKNIHTAKAGEVLVDDDEMQMAIDNQEEYYAHWQKMLSEWKISPKAGESQLTTDVAKRERLKAVLKLKEYISRQRVIEETGWNDGSRNLKDTIDSFIEENKVQSFSLGNSRELIQHFIADAEWIEFNRIKLPVRGQAPIFYRWIGGE